MKLLICIAIYLMDYHSYFSPILQKEKSNNRKSLMDTSCFPYTIDLFILKNCIGDVASFHVSGDINAPNTEIYYYHGTAPNEMLAKKSAKYLKKHYEKVNVRCFKGRGHCELSLLYPDKMIQELKKITGQI